MIAPVLSVFFAAFAAGFEMNAKFRDGFRERVNPFVLGSDGSNHRRMPAVSGHDERKHGLNLLFETVGPFPIGFVKDEDVRDFHQAGFHVLNIVAEARYKNDHYAIGEPYDVNFILANANGFNEDLALACRVEEQRNFGCGAREATKKSASSHGA